MDLGCLDLGCISVSDKKIDSENKENEAGSDSATATSKIGKNKQMKENGQTSLNSVNKSASQIKKPSHRRNSPINWFPRRKVDSYLNRKIKMLQEVAGMNLTLDETLGDSNPHYSKVLREKMAAREAANKAIEARKAALVEASWCRILKAARIRRKEAEEQLVKAEETAAQAFEAALAIGVNMYDIPNCPQKPNQVETCYSTTAKGSSTLHGVTASFETAFEVDKEVAASVKSALISLANSASFQKDEFKDLLRKISQNPDTDKNEEERQSEESSSPETLSGKDSVSQLRQQRSKKRRSLEKLNAKRLMGMMFERLESLQEDELSSLATIVATCGLNAALAEIESNKLHDLQGSKDSTESHRRMSYWGAAGKKQREPEIPSLEKVLVKHVTKLEREVQEARNRRDEESKERKVDFVEETVPDLESILLKHSSKLEKEIEEAKRSSSSVGDFKMGNKNFPGDNTNPGLESVLGNKHSSKSRKEIEEAKKNFDRELRDATNGSIREHNTPELLGLDKVLVKHVSRLEKEVQEANSRRRIETNSNGPIIGGKENEGDPNMKQIEDNGLDKILVKPVHRLEREKMQALALESKPQKKPNIVVAEFDSLDKVLVKHVSKLEKEKMRVVAGLEESESESLELRKANKSQRSEQCGGGGLDQILVKHKSRLEREKLVQEEHDDRAVSSSSVASLREARERELQEAWGGLGLGNAMKKPHLSKLERDKAAWIKAEQEERRQAMVFSDL